MLAFKADLTMMSPGWRDDTMKSILKIWSVVAIVAVALLAVGCKKGKKEGERCKAHKDCRKPFKCVNGYCVDITGDTPQCKWALDCLRKLASSKDKAADRRTARKQYRKLSRLPIKKDCRALAELGIPQGQQPWVWKPLCGAPPISGIRKTGGGNPFRVLDSKITASRVPPDDKFFAKRTGPGHFIDQCKGWVKFEVTRKFQGRVVAVFYTEYDCQKVDAKNEEGKKIKKDVCKTRRYQRTDSNYYIYLTKPGTVKALNFYVETPPDVCRGRVKKEFPTGCYCKGISETKISLEAQEDEFLHPVDIKMAKDDEKRMKNR